MAPAQTADHERPSTEDHQQNVPKIAPIFATATTTKFKVVDLESKDTLSNTVVVDESSKRSKKQVAALQEPMQEDLQHERASGANIVPDHPDCMLCKCQLALIDLKKAIYADVVMHKERKPCPEPDWQLQFSAPSYEEQKKKDWYWQHMFKHKEQSKWLHCATLISTNHLLHSLNAGYNHVCAYSWLNNKGNVQQCLHPLKLTVHKSKTLLSFWQRGASFINTASSHE